MGLCSALCAPFILASIRISVLCPQREIYGRRDIDLPALLTQSAVAEVRNHCRYSKHRKVIRSSPPRSYRVDRITCSSVQCCTSGLKRASDGERFGRGPVSFMTSRSLHPTRFQQRPEVRCIRSAPTGRNGLVLSSSSRSKQAANGVRHALSRCGTTPERRNQQACTVTSASTYGWRRRCRAPKAGQDGTISDAHLSRTGAAYAAHGRDMYPACVPPSGQVPLRSHSGQLQSRACRRGGYRARGLGRRRVRRPARYRT